MTVYLVLDLIWFVRHENAAVGVASTHFRLWSLKSRKEFGVEKRRLGVLELHGDVTSKTEVGVLIDCAGNQARDVGYCTKDVGKGI